MTPANKTILDYLHFHCPTSEQKAALLAMSAFVAGTNTDDFFILCGAAGTGKTSITSALIGYLTNNKVRYRIAAPTGRAARILGRKTGTVSNTIHSMIYKSEANKETGAVKFTLKTNRFAEYCIFIIDESSMVSGRAVNQGLFQSDDSLLNDLVKFVKNGNPMNKIIFLGDRNQLPPVGEEDALALDPNFLRKKFNWQGSFHYLTEVKRQEDGSYILKNAIKVRQAIDSKQVVIPAVEAFKHRNGFAAAKYYAANFDASNPDRSIAIGLSHKANKIFNDEVRKNMFGPGCKLVQAGDMMIVVQNWKRDNNALSNGDHVIVEEVYLDQLEEVAGLHFTPVKLKACGLDGTEQVIEDYMVLDILLGEKPELDSSRENMLRAERFRKNKVYSNSGFPEDDRYVGALRLGYGYAITCNKAQGGEWDKVFVNTFGVRDLRWTYTAITRAKEDLELY
jgi:exodeoxyribonuclease-5